MFDTLSDDEDFALEGVLIGQIRRAADKDLTNHGFDIFRGLGQTRVVARNIAPAKE